MADVQFTPGPWAFLWNVPDIEKAEPTAGVAWLGTGDIKGRCRVDVAGPNAFANANVIAAAPEMYEALDALIDSFDDTPAARLGRAALAKARGESVSA